MIYHKQLSYFLDGGEEEGEEIGEKEGQYFVDQATGQYYFQTSDGETMTVVSAPGVEEPSKYIYNFLHSFGKTKVKLYLKGYIEII